MGVASLILPSSTFDPSDWSNWDPHTTYSGGHSMPPGVGLFRLAITLASVIGRARVMDERPRAQVLREIFTENWMRFDQHSAAKIRCGELLGAWLDQAHEHPSTCVLYHDLVHRRMGRAAWGVFIWTYGLGSCHGKHGLRSRCFYIWGKRGWWRKCVCIWDNKNLCYGQKRILMQKPKG